MTKLKEIHGRKPMHEHSSSDIEEVDPIFAAWLANYVPYVHPDGFSNQPAEPLPGNTVIARININTQGHVEGIETKDIPSDLFCYMAWRDAPGTGFILTPNNNSAFEAILFTHTEITEPVEADFEGLWRSVIPATGITGGTKGQVFIKNSENEYDYGWADLLDDITFEFRDIDGTDLVYALRVSASFAFTINSISLITDLGSITGITVKIDNVAVTGLADLTATTTLTHPAATGNNRVEVGSYVTLKITGAKSSATKLIGELHITR